MVHQLYYPAPIVSIGLSPNDSHLIVGMADNMLSIKHKNFHGRYKKQQTGKQQWFKLSEISH